MNFAEYQQAAARTLNVGLEQEKKTLMAALGLGGESGEVQEMIKKHYFHGHDLDKKKLAIELGDVLWYLAAIATVLGISLDRVAEGNIEKLLERYPNGFSENDSKTRREYNESTTE